MLDMIHQIESTMNTWHPVGSPLSDGGGMMQIIEARNDSVDVWMLQIYRGLLNFSVSVLLKFESKAKPLENCSQIMLEFPLYLWSSQSLVMIPILKEKVFNTDNRCNQVQSNVMLVGNIVSRMGFSCMGWHCPKLWDCEWRFDISMEWWYFFCEGGGWHVMTGWFKCGKPMTQETCGWEGNFPDGISHSEFLGIMSIQSTEVRASFLLLKLIFKTDGTGWRWCTQTKTVLLCFCWKVEFRASIQQLRY